MSEPVTEAPPAAFTGRFVTANHYRIPPWEARLAKIVDLMSSANAHWFGTQETEEIAERGIVRGIQPTGVYKVFSDKVNITLIGRSDLFRVLWHREYAMAGDDRLRYYQAAKVQHIETGVISLAVNTHFSNGSKWAAVRVGQARAIVATITDLVKTGVITEESPIILTGDFNDTRRANTPGSPAAIFKAAGLVDARDVVGMVSRIDLVYGRNITFRAWNRIETGTVSDHDWYVVTADVGIGAPKPPPPIVPKPTPAPVVRMYVRSAADPIWKRRPFLLQNRTGPGPDDLGDKERPPGYAVVGTVVEKWGGEFIKTASGRYYRVTYLTLEKPR